MFQKQTTVKLLKNDHCKKHENKIKFFPSYVNIIAFLKSKQLLKCINKRNILF